MPLRPRWTSIVVTWPQRAFSAKKISDESEITEEWKEVSGRRTTSRSCYYRDSGLVQNALCDTGYTTTGLKFLARPVAATKVMDSAGRARSAFSDQHSASEPRPSAFA